MQVLSINIGDYTCASSHYRICQYVGPLYRADIRLRVMTAHEFSGRTNLARWDAVIVQKRLFSLGKVRRMRREAKKLIFDLDDAIWAPQRRRRGLISTIRIQLRLRAIARAADICLVANDFLAEKLRGYGAKVEVLPMALDERSWCAAEPGKSGERLRIGWAGSPGNLRYLGTIEPALAAVQRKFPQVELAFHCGRFPHFHQDIPFTYLPYRGAEEPAVIRSFDIGLAPLRDNEFDKGKSPIKCIQYMASGVATVVSPIGTAGTMFTDGVNGLFASTQEEWIAAIERLVGDPKLRLRLGYAARQEFLAKHALSRHGARLIEILRTL